MKNASNILRTAPNADTVEGRAAIQDRILWSINTMGHGTFALCVGLDAVAPVAGRTWHAVCASCYFAAGMDSSTPDGLTFYASHNPAAKAECGTCAYSGPDTWIVSVAL